MAACLVIENGGVKLFFSGEVPEDHGLRDTCRVSDLFRGCTAETSIGEETYSHRQDLRPALFTGHSGATRRALNRQLLTQFFPLFPLPVGKVSTYLPSAHSDVKHDFAASAFSALNRFFNAESTEVRKRAQRRHCSLYRFNLSGEVLRTLSQQGACKMQSNKLISVGTNVARLLLSLSLISKLKGRESLCQRMEASTKQQPAPPQAQEQQAPAREQRFRKPRRTTVKKFLTSQARQKIT